MDVDTAAIRIASLFPDEGATVLAEAGLPNTWEQALGVLPEAALAADGVAVEHQGERLLELIREHYSQQGELRPAVAITRALARRRARDLGDEHPDTLVEVGALGALADRAGRILEASEYLQQAYEGLRKVAGGRDMRLAVVSANLAWHCLRTRRVDEAEQYLMQALRIRRTSAPETVGPIAAQLSELLMRRNAVGEAVPLMMEAWEAYKRDLGPTDPRTVARAKALTATLIGLGREKEAIPPLRLLWQSTTDPEQKHELGMQFGAALEAAGLREEAYRVVDEAMRWTQGAGAPHPQLANRLTVFARMLLRRSRLGEAEGLMLQAIEVDRHEHGDNHVLVAIRMSQLGTLYIQLGRPEEAMGWLEPSVHILVRDLGDDDPQTRVAVEALAQLWFEAGMRAWKSRDQRQGRELLAKAKGLALPTLGERHRLVLEIEKLGIV